MKIASKKLTVSLAAAVLAPTGEEGVKAEAEKAKQLTTTAEIIMVSVSLDIVSEWWFDRQE